MHEFLRDMEPKKGDQIQTAHLLMETRACRVCGEEKNLIDGFYRTRKSRGAVPSSYSYECKICTIRRIVNKRKKKAFSDWAYPDW